MTSDARLSRDPWSSEKCALVIQRAVVVPVWIEADRVTHISRESPTVRSCGSLVNLTLALLALVVIHGTVVVVIVVGAAGIADTAGIAVVAVIDVVVGIAVIVVVGVIVVVAVIATVVVVVTVVAVVAVTVAVAVVVASQQWGAPARSTAARPVEVAI